MYFIRRKKPEGYKELLVYKRAEELRRYVFEITENFPREERRRKEHMRDSARSVKQNIVEGWKRETTRQYIDFLSYSFGSLGELKEDGKDCFEDKLISKEVFDELMRRCGELDFLMGRLKSSLERKIDKKEYLSPYQKWLGMKMEQKIREDKEKDKRFAKFLEERFNLVKLPDGRIVKKEDLEKSEKGKKGERGEKGRE
jgi:four helix bundle protein